MHTKNYYRTRVKWFLESEINVEKIKLDQFSKKLNQVKISKNYSGLTKIHTNHIIAASRDMH